MVPGYLRSARNKCLCDGLPIGEVGKRGSSGGMRVLSLVIALVLEAAAHECERFSNDGGDYYEAISDCGACAANPSCGFCLSTLQCMERGSDGPLSGLPCNYWLTAAAECPEIPQCEQLSSCGVCVDMEGCAWCASEQRCLTVSEIFSQSAKVPSSTRRVHLTPSKFMHVPVEG